MTKVRSEYLPAPLTNVGAKKVSGSGTDALMVHGWDASRPAEESPRKILLVVLTALGDSTWGHVVQIFTTA